MSEEHEESVRRMRKEAGPNIWWRLQRISESEEELFGDWSESEEEEVESECEETEIESECEEFVEEEEESEGSEDSEEVPYGFGSSDS